MYDHPDTPAAWRERLEALARQAAALADGYAGYPADERTEAASRLHDELAVLAAPLQQALETGPRRVVVARYPDEHEVWQRPDGTPVAAYTHLVGTLTTKTDALRVANRHGDPRPADV